MNPENVVETQVNAYNERNLDQFISCHAQEVELYNYPENVPFAIGRNQIKEIYQDVFEQSPNLNTEILSRMVMGNKVIDHERITGRKGIKSFELIAIYEIENGLISKARFIRDK